MKKTISAAFLGASILVGCVTHPTQDGYNNHQTTQSDNASGNKASLSSGTSTTGDSSPITSHKEGAQGTDFSALPISK